jgi:hypothetical protein
MFSPALHLRCCVVLALLLSASTSHALGHEDPLQPGDLDSPEPSPELYRAGVAVQLVFPLGRANRQTDHSLGWCVGALRWLRPGLGLSASLSHLVLAKDAILPGDIELHLWSARAGIRGESQISPRHALFADAHAILVVKTASNGGATQTSSSRGAGLSAGAIVRVAPDIYARFQASYAAAQHRMAAIEFGFSVGF